MNIKFMQKKSMKKFLKLFVAIIFAIAIIGAVMFLIDCSKIKSGKTPLFAQVTGTLNDGGTIEYTGLGYKIIDFNRLNGYDETKIGLWYIKYEDYEEEYKKLDKDIVNDESKKENEEISEDIINNEVISGDIEFIDTPSGEIDSSDILDNNEISGDNVEINDVSGELIDNVETNNTFYFNATVIGINNRNLVVQALENDAINASADMFSFSLPESDSSEYLIGQKVKIEYTGTIRESYPAQIDVLGIEIIE